jgi:replicative DNA helicase
MKQAGHEAVITAEYRLLNALIKDEEYRRDSRVYSDLLIHEVAKSIYQAIEKLDEAEVEVTAPSLFQAANEIDYNVSKSVIDAIVAMDETGASTLEDILATLESAKQKKALSEKLEELTRIANSAGPLDMEKTIEGLYAVDRILKTNTGASLLKDFDRWSDEYILELQERSKGKVYAYGDENLDRFIFKGAYPGAITTIAAGTGQGKSTYVLNLINTLIDSYVPCMYISLEMSGMDTYDRLIALRREIPMEHLHACDESLLSVVDLVREEKKALENNKRFYFVEEPLLSISRLRSLIKEFKQRAKTDYAIVAIDLVTQITDFMHNKGNASVANSIETAMNDLNALAKEQSIHIIAVTQFNREADNYKVTCVEDLEMLRPTLNHIKNSAAIAERSRVVLSLFRKKYYSDRYLVNDPAAEEIPDILEAAILKNSSGPVGHVFKYMFEGSIFRCTPMLEEPLIVE